MFKDQFSKQSNTYAKHRPTYPKELFEYLSSLCNEHELVWDCATGNGQAARAIAEYFDHVIATDASEVQISNAVPHPKVEYRVALAQDSGLKDGSIDLITVAAGLHWFAGPDFFNEAKRVLKPEGIIACWAYGFMDYDEEIKKITKPLAFDKLHDYWAPEVKHAWNRYQDIEFPFQEIEHPPFKIRKTWTAHDMIGYLESWSSTNNYIKQHNEDPLIEVREQLMEVWGDEEKEVSWELFMRVGRKD